MKPESTKETCLNGFYGGYNGKWVFWRVFLYWAGADRVNAVRRVGAKVCRAA